MEDKKHYQDLYKHHFDCALEKARKSEWQASKEEFLKAFQCSKKLFEITFGLEKASHIKEMQTVKHLIGELNRRMGASSEGSDKKDEPEKPKKMSAEELFSLVEETVVSDDVKKWLCEQIVSFQRRALKSAPEGEKIQLPLYTFIGDYGTGKSHVAKILAKIYYAFGYLETDEVIECSRGDIAGGYVSYSYNKTDKMIKSAKGKVLLIDSVNQIFTDLVRYPKSSFMTEIVARLGEELMNPDRTLIIFTERECIDEDFLRANETFASRIREDNRIYFSDFGEEQIFRVVLNLAKSKDLCFSDSALCKVREKIAKALLSGPKWIGNARYAHNLFDDIFAQQAKRLYSKNENGAKLTKAELCEILPEDVV